MWKTDSIQRRLWLIVGVSHVISTLIMLILLILLCHVAGRSELVAYVLALGTFSIAFGFWQAKMCARSFLAPIVQLVNAVRRVEQGHYFSDVDNKVLGIKELRPLGEAVKSMQNKLLKREEELSAIYEALEETIRKKTQEVEVVRAQSLESARLASLGELAAGVAHEIASPLTVMKGLTLELQQGIEAKTFESAHLKDYLGSLDHMMQRMLELVRGLLNLSHLSPDETQSSVLVSEMIHDVKVVCLEKAKRAGVKLLFTGPTHAYQLSILGHASQLAQLLINLINNAFDAVSQMRNPTIEIRVGEEYPGFLNLQCIDNGPGIPEEVRGRLFEAFVTSKPKGKGTGLGLALAKKIVENHRGTIEWKELDGKTCFQLRIPVDLSTPAAMDDE
jgi:C4-dicarboxylate-specific signal transduction histidine kinase